MAVKRGTWDWWGNPARANVFKFGGVWRGYRARSGQYRTFRTWRAAMRYALGE